MSKSCWFIFPKLGTDYSYLTTSTAPASSSPSGALWCVCAWGGGGDLEVPCRASCYPSSWCILGDGIVLGKGGERLRQQPSAQQSGVFQQWPFNMATPVSANISTALGPR